MAVRDRRLTPENKVKRVEFAEHLGVGAGRAVALREGEREREVAL